MASFTTEDIRLAQESERKYGVPASVTLAQYALESGYGTSSLAKNNQNYFGMRNGSKGWQSFSSKSDSFDAHGKLLASSTYSSKTNGVTSIEGYVNAIAETYAPSSDGNNDYAGQIMNIIESNNLTQYDVGTWHTGYTMDVAESNESDGILESTGKKILGYVIKAGAIVFVAVLGFVFLMGALDISIENPVKKLKGGGGK